MAKKNSINNETQELTVDPGAGTDSFAQFDIGGTNEFRTGVDDTDGFYKISAGGALGTTDTFVMTDSGERTMPLNPVFRVYRSSDQFNVTGDGTAYVVPNNTEDFDVGGNYNTGTFTFTAPVTGRYLLSIYTVGNQLSSSHSDNLIAVVTSNRTLNGTQYANVVVEPEGRLGTLTTVLTDMDAADTATSQYTVSGGALAVDVLSGTNNTRIAGELVT